MAIEAMLSQKGKVAVITGAASGIGRATAELFAEAGAAVALVDIDKKNAASVAQQIRKNGGTAKVYACDVTSQGDVQAAAAAIVRDFSRIDVLLNNAGIIRRTSVVDATEADWDKVIDVTLKGAYLFSKYCIPVMQQTKGGSIVMTSSGWGLKGGPNAAAYCAAKAGIVNLTRSMAIDFGKYNIRVNCVCPGDIDTPLLHDEAKQLGQDEASFLKEAALRPLCRIGQPRDVANAVLFLSSDMAAWITGTSLVVDGGGIA